jgi:hypothetical protein
LPPTPDETARFRRVEEREASLTAALGIILDLTRLTIGPGETDEYEHVDLERRYVEVAAFYHWWIVNLIFAETEYEWKTDYADAITYNLLRNLSGVQAVLDARWREYEGNDPDEPVQAKAARAARRTLYHIDPEVPVPDEFAEALATDGTAAATDFFREQTEWA